MLEPKEEDLVEESEANPCVAPETVAYEVEVLSGEVVVFGRGTVTVAMIGAVEETVVLGRSPPNRPPFVELGTTTGFGSTGAVL